MFKLNKYKPYGIYVEGVYQLNIISKPTNTEIYKEVLLDMIKEIEVKTELFFIKELNNLPVEKKQIKLHFIRTGLHGKNRSINLINGLYMCSQTRDINEVNRINKILKQTI